MAKAADTADAYQAYLDAHADGTHIEEAENALKKVKSRDLQPEEKQMVSGLFRQFFQSINSRNADGLTATCEDILSSLLGKNSATKADVVTFMDKLYKDDVANMNWHINNDYQIKKREVGDEDYEYQVQFSARQDIDLTDGSKKEQLFKISAVVSPDGKVSAFNMNKVSELQPKAEREKLPECRGFYTDVILYGAWKQGIAHDGESSFLLDGKYAVMGLNINPMYRLNPWLSVGASLDGMYDRSASRENDVWGEEVEHKFTRQSALGLSARGEFSMPYFSINFGAGTYLLGNRNDFNGVYEVLALKVHVSRRAMVHIGYSLVDFKTPNNLMLGLGWRFGGK